MALNQFLRHISYRQDICCTLENNKSWHVRSYSPWETTSPKKTILSDDLVILHKICFIFVPVLCYACEYLMEVWYVRVDLWQHTIAP